MFKAEISDRSLVVALLANSFEDNRSINYIIRNDEHRLKRIVALMEYSFDVCSLFGEIWLSDDRKGCALVLFPHLKKTTIASVWLDTKLILKAIGISRVQTALNREKKIKGIQPKTEMLYLWFIGVAQIDQHNGIGSGLLKQLLAKADLLKLPVLLETSTLKNIPWYENFGFKIYNQLELGYTLFFLKREMGK